MEFRSLRPEELGAWGAHCESVFYSPGNPTDSNYFLNHYRNDPWRDLDGILVAVDGGSIVSTVRVFRRKVWLLGAEVTMGGIGEVSTKPAYRGIGLSGTLLQMSVDWMIKRGLAVSVLYSGLHSFYRRYGWECIPKTVARFSGVMGTPCEGRAMEPGDLPAMRIVDAAAAGTNWRVVREGEEYWDKWMRAAIGKCVVATEGSSVVAWLACEADGERLTVRDFRALPGYEGRFEGLCRLAAGLEGFSGGECAAPAWFAGGLRLTGTETLDYCMVRLNIPFEASGKTIDNTKDLIAMTGEYRDSELDHF